MDTLKIYNNTTKLPLGKWLFSKILGFIAPYFATISPLIETLEPGKSIVIIKDRRKIRNHFGSIHAGALCNLAELAGGLTLDVTLDKQYRWIPMGMTLKYLKKAHGPLKAICIIDGSQLSVGQTSAKVEIVAEDNTVVSKAEIEFNIKER